MTDQPPPRQLSEDVIIAQRVIANLNEVISIANSLRTGCQQVVRNNLNLSSAIGLTEGGMAWDEVGVLAGDVANIADALWPDEDDGPVC